MSVLRAIYSLQSSCLTSSNKNYQAQFEYFNSLQQIYRIVLGDFFGELYSFCIKEYHVGANVIDPHVNRGSRESFLCLCFCLFLDMITQETIEEFEHVQG